MYRLGCWLHASDIPFHFGSLTTSTITLLCRTFELSFTSIVRISRLLCLISLVLYSRMTPTSNPFFAFSELAFALFSFASAAVFFSLAFCCAFVVFSIFLLAFVSAFTVCQSILHVGAPPTFSAFRRCFSAFLNSFSLFLSSLTVPLSDLARSFSRLVRSLSLLSD